MKTALSKNCHASHAHACTHAHTHTHKATTTNSLTKPTDMIIGIVIIQRSGKKVRLSPLGPQPKRQHCSDQHAMHGLVCTSEMSTKASTICAMELSKVISAIT